jgi:hypothetical protein
MKNNLIGFLAVNAAVLCAFLTTSFGQGHDMDRAIPVLETRSDVTAPVAMMIPSANGPVRAVIRKQDVRIKRGSEGDAQAEMHTALVVLVPSIKVYWLGRSSEHQPFEKGDIERKFFVINSKIIGVAPGWGDVLTFYSSDDPMLSDNEDQAARLALQKRYKEATHRWLDIDGKSIRMEDLLGQFPFTRKPDPRGEPAPRITNIVVNKDNSFVVTLRGGKEGKVEAVIAFNAAFTPLSATLNGKQVYPNLTK